MEILILTGACGVGKSTIATAWATLKKGAIIECDYFTEWIFNPDFPRWDEGEEKFVAQLALVTAREYIRQGMSVAIEYVWTPTGLKILVDQLQQQSEVTSIKVVWLYCALPENHRRDGLRVPENQMKKRVDIVNEQLAACVFPDYLTKIDSTRLTIPETVQQIEAIARLES